MRVFHRVPSVIVAFACFGHAAPSAAQAPARPAPPGTAQAPANGAAEGDNAAPPEALPAEDGSRAGDELGEPPAPPPGTSPTAPTAVPAAPPVTSAPAAPPSNGPPGRTLKPAASGFQAAFRSGVLIPAGDATGAPGDSLGRRYAWQVPLAADLGVRFARSFFVGAYLGAGFGSTGSDSRLEAACRDDDDNLENEIVCSAFTLRFGLTAHYHFEPDARIDPWIGYGIGFESSIATLSDEVRGYRETVTSSGLTFAQLTAGFDARHGIGIGPFVEVALGRFDRTTTEVSDQSVSTSNIDDRALHAWVMIGGRLVINP